MSTTFVPKFITSIPTLPAISSIRGQLRRVYSSNACLKQDSIQELTSRRAQFKSEMLCRDAIIRQAIYPDSHGKIQQDNLMAQSDIDVITDLDTQPLLFSRIASIVSSCPPSLLAEIREWQHAAHVIACIDTAISYISSAMTHEPDPLAERICDTMMATILAFPLPQSPQPVQQRPDDRERVMDRPVFYDEPQMRTLIASFDDGSRSLLKAAADRERSRLPIFPPYLGGDPETKC